MKNTFKHAAERIADQARARGVRIEQVDPVLCETGKAISFYAYNERGETFIASIDLPSKITDDAFLYSEWRAAFMAAIPSDARALTAWP